MNVLLQAELTTSLTKGAEKMTTAKEADQAAGASAAQLASRQAQEQVQICTCFNDRVLYRVRCSTMNGKDCSSHRLKHCLHFQSTAV